MEYNKRFILGKYKGLFWAVLDTKSRVWLCIGKGRAHCEKRIKELNKNIKGAQIWEQ